MSDGHGNRSAIAVLNHIVMKRPIALVIFATALFSQSLAKTKSGACDNPQSDTCFAAVVQNANALKARMKNPDSFRLTKVSVTEKGYVCYRYSAETGLGALPSSVAIWFPHDVPFDVLLSLNEDGHQLFGHGLVNDVQDNVGLTKQCGTGTLLDPGKITTAMSASGQRDF